MKNQARNQPPGQRERGKTARLFLGIKNARVWCLGLSYTIMMLGNVGFLSFATQYFTRFCISNPRWPARYQSGLVHNRRHRCRHRLRLRKTSSLKPQFVQIIVCSACALAILPFGFLLPWSVMLPYLFALGFINGYTLAVILRQCKVRYAPAYRRQHSIIFFTQNMGAFRSAAYGQAY